jgi:hypothetical protein
MRLGAIGSLWAFHFFKTIFLTQKLRFLNSQEEFWETKVGYGGSQVQGSLRGEGTLSHFLPGS